MTPKMESAPPRVARTRGATLAGRVAQLLMAGWLALAGSGHAEELDVPYVTTPQGVVDAMLALAGVGPGDTLIDLGSGDGRIVITAAQRFGVPGIGVEIDPRLIALARANAQAAGVGDKARFVEQDLFTTDLRGASVITLYLLPDVNLKLRPLLRTLKPGTRIVSHDWDMGDWAPDRTIRVPAPDKKIGLAKESRLMLWIVR